MKKGKIIVFEGLDYSFKETNSKRLYEYIKNNISEKVKLISFPSYESNSSYFIKEYLNGNYGECNEVNAKTSSLFYALDRYDTLKKLNIERLLEEGYYIIMDRYVGSNMIFQNVKLNDNERTTEFISSLETLEYDTLGIPKSDITIYMDMPLGVSWKLMKERNLKNKMSKDIHEDNKEFLMKVELSALFIANYLDWNIISCIDSNHDIRTEDELFNNVLEILENILV